MLIREKLEQGDFSNNERAVASYILEQKLNIKNMTVKEIAEATFTSSSALSRVACKMNYKSWNAFKEAYLEEELYLESHFHEIDANYPFNRKDSFISIESKLAVAHEAERCRRTTIPYYWKMTFNYEMGPF